MFKIKYIYIIVSLVYLSCVSKNQSVGSIKDAGDDKVGTGADSLLTLYGIYWKSLTDSTEKSVIDYLNDNTPFYRVLMQTSVSKMVVIITQEKKYKLSTKLYIPDSSSLPFTYSRGNFDQVSGVLSKKKWEELKVLSQQVVACDTSDTMSDTSFLSLYDISNVDRIQCFKKNIRINNKTIEFCVFMDLDSFRLEENPGVYYFEYFNGTQLRILISTANREGIVKTLSEKLIRYGESEILDEK